MDINTNVDVNLSVVDIHNRTSAKSELWVTIMWESNTQYSIADIRKVLRINSAQNSVQQILCGDLLLGIISHMGSFPS